MLANVIFGSPATVTTRYIVTMLAPRPRCTAGLTTTPFAYAAVGARTGATGGTVTTADACGCAAENRLTSLPATPPPAPARFPYFSRSPVRQVLHRFGKRFVKSQDMTPSDWL